jgi:hypothetical protein
VASDSAKFERQEAQIGRKEREEYWMNKMEHVLLYSTSFYHISNNSNKESFINSFHITSSYQFPSTQTWLKDANAYIS